MIRRFGDLAAYLDLISRRAALQVPFRFEISREASSHARRDPLAKSLPVGREVLPACRLLSEHLNRARVWNPPAADSALDAILPFPAGYLASLCN